MNQKVYVVEVGEYSGRYIDAIFTTRELAESFVIARARIGWNDARGGHAGPPPFPEPAGRSFDEWRKEAEWGGHTNDWGYVAEYDLWSLLPIVRPGEDEAVEIDEDASQKLVAMRDGETFVSRSTYQVPDDGPVVLLEQTPFERTDAARSPRTS